MKYEQRKPFVAFMKASPDFSFKDTPCKGCQYGYWDELTEDDPNDLDATHGWFCHNRAIIEAGDRSSWNGSIQYGDCWGFRPTKELRDAMKAKS